MTPLARRFFLYSIRTFSNWPLLLLRRLQNRKDATLIMRDGPTFFTPNFYETIPIIYEIFDQKLYGDLAGLPEDAVILDVGGYIGTFALYALFKCPRATIHVFEPEPSNFRALQRNTCQYPAIVPHQLAVSDRTGKATLNVRGEGSGTNSLYKPSKNQVEVPTTTLQDFMAGQGIAHAHLLKLDCEQAERPILKTLPQNIGKVLVEWTNPEPPPAVSVPIQFVKLYSMP